MVPQGLRQKRFGRASVAWVFALLSVLTFNAVAVEKPLTKKIAIVHSYVPGEWYHGLNRGFEETLGQIGVPFELTPMLFDSEHWLAKPEREQQKERLRILEAIRALNPNLVVVCDDEAADALIPLLQPTRIPIVFTGINRNADQIPWLKETHKSPITGVLEAYPVSGFIGALEKLLPEVKTLSILSSRKPSSQHVCSSTEREMNSKEFLSSHRVRLNGIHMLSHWEEWKELLPTLNKKGNAVWVLVPYDVKDTNNIQVPLPQMGTWFRKKLKVPYIGMSVVHTKMGGLMSVQITPYDLGRQAAELASKFFNGIPLEKLPLEKARYHQIEINATEARRLKVAIPKDLLGVATLVEDPSLKYGR